MSLDVSTQEILGLDLVDRLRWKGDRRHLSSPVSFFLVVPSPQAHYQDWFFSTLGVRIYLELVRSTHLAWSLSSNCHCPWRKGDNWRKGTIFLTFHSNWPTSVDLDRSLLWQQWKCCHRNHTQYWDHDLRLTNQMVDLAFWKCFCQSWLYTVQMRECHAFFSSLILPCTEGSKAAYSQSWGTTW